MSKGESFGLPYMGSKNELAKDIVSLIPPCSHFYDLFGGGGAITHCASLSGKWDTVHYNDFDSFTVKYFENALNGKWDTNKVYTRNDFHKYKGTNPYVNYVWSFNSGGDSYFMGAKVEKTVGLEQYVSENMLTRIRRVENVGKIPRNRVVVTNKSYDKVKILPDSVIYLDPPYIDTASYKSGGIDYDKLYDFCEKSKALVFISSYWLPNDRFVAVRSYVHTNFYNYESRVEKVFIPRCQFGMYAKMCA